VSTVSVAICALTLGVLPVGRERAVASRVPAALAHEPSPAFGIGTLHAGPATGPARAVWASGELVGARYQLSPLGEGVPPDGDPRFSLGEFDCVTLVETTIALGHARSIAEARVLLDDVRYHGLPTFENRNHYVEAQWIPVNARKGWIEDSTRSLAGLQTLEAVLIHTPARWREASRVGNLVRGLDPSALPIGVFRLPFVPLSQIAAIVPRIPAGTIAFVVRAERRGRPYRVTHMGIIVVAASGRRLVRHASSSARRVVDEPLDRFVSRHAAQRSWPVVGISLWAIRNNDARARILLDPAGELPGLARALSDVFGSTGSQENSCRLPVEAGVTTPTWEATAPGWTSAWRDAGP